MLQVGFTTTPSDGRSTLYCTDIAKGLGIPVLHANADDPEAVVRACKLAADWRSRYHEDIVVDIVGYRRNGHNVSLKASILFRGPYVRVLGPHMQYIAVHATSCWPHT